MVKNGQVCVRGKLPIRLELIPVSAALSDQGYFYTPHSMGAIFMIGLPPPPQQSVCLRWREAP